jgi:hypothetical protein
VPESRKRGSKSPLPNTPSWRGAQKKSTGTTSLLRFQMGEEKTKFYEQNDGKHFLNTFVLSFLVKANRFDIVFTNI